MAVSYTHLDVYKRQSLAAPGGYRAADRDGICDYAAQSSGWTYTDEDLSLIHIFCLLGGGFFLAGPKAALFVSGFSTLPPSERARYDTAALSRDYARRFLGWGVLFLAGAGASALWSGWAALLALAVWQVLFWRQVHWDPERAFETYRLPHQKEDSSC